MRKLLYIFGLLLLVGTGYYFIQDYVDISKKDVIEKINAPKLKSNQTKKDKKSFLHGDLFHMMGESKEELEKQLGDPVRKDPTPYGYTWWVYKDNTSNYVLYGVEEDKIETIFATGDDISSTPFQIGHSYEQIEKNFPFEEQITYQNGLSFYTFKLKDTDIQTNPLIKLSDDLFVVCYFDTFTDTLSSIRMMTGDMLTKQRFYEMEYRGPLPEEDELSDEEWLKAEESMEQQIFELTNLYRERFNITPLELDEDVSKVALLHSMDMYEHNYFSHTSQNGNGLKERLEEESVYYLSAGENIAAQHTDAPAAMEGWLNSEGHRDALLYEDYNYIGIGVYRLYYTQNFLLKP